MLIYHAESDSLFFDPSFEFEGPDAGLCLDVTETFWAVVVAKERGVEVPEVERHLQYLRDIGADDLPTDDPANPYWNDL